MILLLKQNYLMKWIKNFQTQPECEDLIKRSGVIIKDIIHIVRKEEPSSLFEDAGFCLETIKQLIEIGRKDADFALSN